MMNVARLILTIIAVTATSLAKADSWTVVQKVSIDASAGMTMLQKGGDGATQGLNDIDLGSVDTLDQTSVTEATQSLNMSGDDLTLIQDPSSTKSKQAANHISVGTAKRPKQEIANAARLRLQQEGSDNVQAGNLLESSNLVENAVQHLSVGSIEMTRNGSGGVGNTQAANLIRATSITGSDNEQSIHVAEKIDMSGGDSQWPNAVTYRDSANGAVITQSVSSPKVTIGGNAVESGTERYPPEPTKVFNYVGNPR